jgi:DNA-nicking Smr family endonuclease
LVRRPQAERVPVLPEGSDEFRAATRDVAPSASVPRRVRAERRPPPIPVQRQRDERAVIGELVYLRPGQSPRVLRRLRRGEWVVQDHFDLHGMSRTEAAEAVTGFLAASLRRDARCVRIIHGKGLGSKNREPVLKEMLKKWLPRHRDVVAFCQAPAPQGGSGALLVLLATRRRGV